MESTSGKLHPVMTVTALAVTVAALAIVVVITGVIPENDNSITPPGGAAAATFSTPLAAKPFTAPSATTTCADCATVVSVQPTAAGTGFWQVAVRMADGSHRLFAAESQPSWHGYRMTAVAKSPTLGRNRSVRQVTKKPTRGGTAPTPVGVGVDISPPAKR